MTRMDSPRAEWREGARGGREGGAERERERDACTYKRIPKVQRQVGPAQCHSMTKKAAQGIGPPPHLGV